MSKLPDVILSPADEQWIAETLSDFAPDLRAEWDRKLRKQLAAKAVSADENRHTFNDAYKRALNTGIADPLDYAERAVELAFKQKIMDWNVAALKARPQIFATKAANRAAEQGERASKSANPGKRRMLQVDRRYLEITGIADRNGQPMSSGSVGAKLRKSSQATSYLTGTRRPCH